MKRSKALIMNTLILTAASLFMRAVALAFQVYLSRKIGAAGIGLYMLTMSVNSFAATFAISGIRFTSMRLTAEELGKHNNDGIKRSVRYCLAYAAVFGILALVILYNAAPFIGEQLIGDARTITSLKLLSLSLPFVSLASVISGYFTAVCRVIKSASVQAAEQFVRIAVVIALLAFNDPGDVERSCAIVVIGGVAGEITSFLLLMMIYKLDSRRYRPNGQKTKGIPKRIFGLALPLGFSAYARTALSTIQNLLVPKGFRKSGASAEKSLADYGMIQGMVFPIITFPSAFFASLAELLIPELTDAQVAGNTVKIERLSSKILKYCFIFSAGVAGIMICFGGELSQVVYKSTEAEKYILILAALLPVMYLDMVTDGILKGLGEQLYSMQINVADSIVSTVMVYLILPQYAIGGYIFILYFSEMFNFVLSIYRLNKKANIKMEIGTCAKTVLSVFTAGSISSYLVSVTGLDDNITAVNVAIAMSGMCVLYCIMLELFGCIDNSDKKWFKNIVM